MTQTEKRRARRERLAAKYAARSFGESVKTTSGHNGHSGVAYAIGGGLVNVPARPLRPRDPTLPKKPKSKRVVSAQVRARELEQLLFGDD